MNAPDPLTEPRLRDGLDMPRRLEQRGQASVRGDARSPLESLIAIGHFDRQHEPKRVCGQLNHLQ